MSFDFRRENLRSMSATELLQRWYHIPAIAVVVVFMFWVRIQSYDRFLREDGGVWLQAVDSWYHWRTTTWTIENYPNTMPYEIWTGFPEGNYVGQFGTLFDQIVATVALIIGLGNPTEQQVLLAALFTVPAMAALVAIPTYYIGRRLGGRAGGIAGIAILALAPVTFLSRTTAGMFQHHVAEVLFMTIAVLATMVALRVAEQDLPIYELVVDRDWEALRRPTIYSALAGVAVVLYVWSWPPGMVLIGILGVFYAIQLSLDVVRGRPADHVAYVGVVSMAVATVGTALLIEVWSSGTTDFGYMQPTLAALVLLGCLFMAWLARGWDSMGYNTRGYPIAIAAGIASGLLVLSVVLPDVYSTVVSNAYGRIFPLGHSPTALTVAEAQPPPDFAQHAFREYGLAFFTAIVTIVLLVLRPLFGREQRAEHVLIVIWSLFLISMAMSQVRFNYYLVVAVAVLNAHLVGLAVEWIDLEDGLNSIEEIESYQILTIGVVIMLLLMPLLPPIASASAVAVGADASPSEDAVKWEPANDWVAENTPEVGNYGGAGNDDQLEYMGTYEYPPDGNYDYPEGAYGVISWWDYGHLITVQGERIPHSNPFQQNARSSSAFLTADSEERGELVLDAVGTGASPANEDDEQLREIVGDGDVDEEIQYVMISDTIVGGKFSAITQWTEPSTDVYFDQEQIDIGDQAQTLPTASSEYDDTMAARLYHQDAADLEHYRLIHENEEFSIVGGVVNPVTGDVRPLESLQIGGDDWNQPLGDDPEGTTPAELDGALWQYSQQNAAFPLGGPQSLQVYDANVASTVKTFERVEGATLEGQTQTATNETVLVQLDLETNANRTFTYSQQVESEEDGSFEVTVPYPTAEEFGPEDGYADSAVRADGEYEISVMTDEGFETADVAVPEQAVQDGETIPVELELIEPEEDAPDPDEDDEGEPEEDEETADEDEETTDEQDETEEEDTADGDEETTDEEETADDAEEDGNDEEETADDDEETTSALAPVRP